MTQISFLHPAPEGAVFSVGCFDSQIGHAIPFRVGDRREDAVLVRAEILPGGRKVRFTLDVPDHLVPRPSLDGISLVDEGAPS